jgi:hypothetical protein
MSPKILPGLGAPPGVKPENESGAPPKPDPRAFKPDPSVMYQAPTEPRRGPEAHSAHVPAELERKPPPALYQSTHFEAPESFMAKEDIDLAKRLCHRIDGEAWPQLYGAFQAELQAARGLASVAESSGSSAGRAWCATPWFYTHLDEHDTSAGEGSRSGSGLRQARALGFRNVGLLDATEDLELDLHAPEARALELRVTTALNLGATSWVRDPRWLADTLREVAAELRRGVSGVRTHGIDRVAAESGEKPRTSAAAHAFQALLKLYLRVLGPHAIIVPELQHAFALASVHAGGSLELEGVASPSEGDLIHWHEGMLALRTALESADRGPLDDALEALPTLLHGARRLCSLEHHDQPGTVVELVGWSPERLALAFTLLYFLPVTPMVYAKSARALPAARVTLRLLNRLRARDRLLAEADLQAVSPEDPRTLFWYRPSLVEGQSALALAANLSGAELEVSVPRSRLERAALGGLNRLRTLGRARSRGRCDDSGLSLSLPPHGFALYEVESDQDSS